MKHFRPGRKLVFCLVAFAAVLLAGTSSSIDLKQSLPTWHTTWEHQAGSDTVVVHSTMLSGPPGLYQRSLLAEASCADCGGLIGVLESSFRLYSPGTRSTATFQFDQPVLRILAVDYLAPD